LVPALYRNMQRFVRSVRQPLYHYMFACMTEQKMADTLLLERTGVIKAGRGSWEELVRQRRSCVCHARAVVAGDPAPPPFPIGRWKIAANAESARLEARPELAELLRVTWELRTPECSGYDLCDVEVVYEDAVEWLRSPGRLSSPPVVIGIRTGGSYYAPFWALAAGQVWGTEIPYYTVRALRTGDSIRYLDEEMALLPADAGMRDIMMVDDQPDSGQTFVALANRLMEKYGASSRIWAASPGRLFRYGSRGIERVKDSVPLRKDIRNRLWQLLGDDDALMNRLRDVPGLEAHLRGSFVVVPRTQRLFWTHPSMRARSPYRINPKKTPFIVRRSVDERPLLFAKFIGKDLFGEYQYAMLKKFAHFLPDKHWFVDGYLITRFEPSLTNIREQTAGLSRETAETLARELIRFLELIWETSAIEEPGMHVWMRRQYHVVAEEAFRRHGVGVGKLRQWLAEDDKGQGRATFVYSSLPYAYQHWHWAFVRSPGPPRMIRFHIDSTWGGITGVEVVAASFLLETRPNLHFVQSFFRSVDTRQPSLVTSGEIVKALPAALLLKMQDFLKNVQTWDDSIKTELSTSINYIQAIQKTVSVESL